MTDLRELAESRGLNLKRFGKVLRGPCPLCKTSRDSQAFIVFETGYYCHACGASDGILAFYRQVLGEVPPEHLFEYGSSPAPDERKRIKARDLDVFEHKAAAARILGAIRKRLRELGPDDIEEVWELREIEEDFEAAIDRTAQVPAKTLRLYLDRLEATRVRAH